MNRPESIEKPRQSIASLWNISFGFLGIQVGFALQTANMSRIFQSLGSSLDDLPALWVAAPLTGLLVQPIVGHLSDRTWLGRMGRRRPYFLAGAFLAALSLVLMPLSSSAAHGGRAAVDARREPQHLDGAVPRLRRRHAAQGPAHRGLCSADRLHRRGRGDRLDLSVVARQAGRLERCAGGRHSRTPSATVSGSAARRCSSRCCGRSSPRANIRPRRWPRFGAAAERSAAKSRRSAHSPTAASERALVWIAIGICVVFAVRRMAAREGSLPARRAADRLRARQRRRDRVGAARPHDEHAGEHRRRLLGHAAIMKRLALAQFFSWSALFIMWINTTPVVARNFYMAPRSRERRLPGCGQLGRRALRRL